MAADETSGTLPGIVRNRPPRIYEHPIRRRTTSLRRYTMSLGPVELLVVEFPGNQFKGEIVPALKELVDKQMIRIVDFVFVRKEADGTVSSLELNQLDDGEYATFDPIVADVTGLLSNDDVRQLGELLDDNSSAGLMLFENVWAKRFADAVVNAHGQVVLNERVPRTVIEQVEEARAAANV